MENVKEFIRMYIMSVKFCFKILANILAYILPCIFVACIMWFCFQGITDAIVQLDNTKTENTIVIEQK